MKQAGGPVQRMRWAVALLLVVASAPIVPASEPYFNLWGYFESFPGGPSDDDPIHYVVFVDDWRDEPQPIPLLDVELRIDGALFHVARVDLNEDGSHFARLDGWVPTEGEHTIELRIDVADEVAESDESDNVVTRSGLFADARPDLSVEILEARATVVPRAGFELRYRVCNVGIGTVSDPTFFVHIVPRSGTLLDHVAPAAHEPFVGGPSLDAGECHEATWKHATLVPPLGPYRANLFGGASVAPYAREQDGSNNQDSHDFVALVPSA